MHVIIYEPDFLGHRLNYVRLIAIGLLGLPGVHVTLCLNQFARKSDEFDLLLRPISSKVSIDFSELSLAGRGAIRAALNKSSGLRRAVERHRPDHVIIPYGDGLSQVARFARATPLFRKAGTEYEVLMLRGGFAYRTRQTWRQRLADEAGLLSLGLAPWDIVHYLDPIPYDFIQRRGGMLARRVDLMPEPVESSPPVEQSSARRQLGLPDNGFLFCVPGVIDARKGVDLLLPAMQAVPDATLLLAGPVSSDIRKLLAGTYRPQVAAGRIHVIDRYLTDELPLAIAASNVVCTPYPNHVGPASIAVRAAAAGRPVLSSSDGWLGATVPRFALGMTCNVRDRASLEAGLVAAMKSGADKLPPDPARERFLRFNTNANFQATWTRRIRHRLNLAPDPNAISWQWVLDGNTTALSSHQEG